MNQLTTLPEKVRAYFRHPAAAYASEGIIRAGLINSGWSWKVLVSGGVCLTVDDVAGKKDPRQRVCSD
jgi:hypothetical protein